MKILLVSHSYPPTWGGVESQNFNLARNLKKMAEVRVIANGKGKKWLPVFLPVAFFRMLFLMFRYDACLLGNGVLAPLGEGVKIFHRNKKFFCVVHGLDVTFARKKGLLSRVYKSVNIPALKKMNRLFVVGTATTEEAVREGIPREKCLFIPNGVEIEGLCQKIDRDEVARILNADISGKKIIFRLGRFVPHKGTSWFIENVMPKLPEAVIFVAAGARVGKKTAGDRDDFTNCQKAIDKHDLRGRVWLLPSISEQDKKVLLNSADLVVSPNIKIEGTMEGFGINVLEAGICGRVVVASGIEGLRDAVTDGENGILLESGNADAWAGKIADLLEKDQFRIEFGKKAKRFVTERYGWDKIARAYLDAIKKTPKE